MKKRPKRPTTRAPRKWVLRTPSPISYGHLNLSNLHTLVLYLPLLTLLKYEFLEERHVTWSLGRKHVAIEDLELEKSSANLISKQWGSPDLLSKTGVLQIYYLNLNFRQSV